MFISQSGLAAALANRAKARRLDEIRAENNKSVIFRVMGKGKFPLDMLRHDQCFPASEGEGEILETRDRVKRIVELRTVNRRLITPGRWLSFGWQVIEIDGQAIN